MNAHFSRVECWRTMVRKLSLWNWLLLAALAHPSLSQNNTCHRIETFNVTLYVPVMEPVTFRSFTWCIAVPPRCSKYTVQLRERLTFKTEVRNRTVTECCEGFVLLYSECVLVCSDCSNMMCDSSRNCTCLPGYIGNQCNESCESGKWGEKCEEVCVCTAEEECNFATGECSPIPLTSSTLPLETATTASDQLNTKTSFSSPIQTIVKSTPETETTQYILHSTETLNDFISLKNTITPTTATTTHIVTEKLLTTMTADKLTNTVHFVDDLQNNSDNFILDEDINSITLYNSVTESTKPFTPTVHTDVVTTHSIRRNKQIISTKLLLNNAVNSTQSADMTVDLNNLSNVTSLDNKFSDDEKSLDIEGNEFSKVLSVNSSIIYAQWINEISANTSITIAAALVMLIVLLVIVVSATLVRCHQHSDKKLPHSNKLKKHDENSAINLLVRNSHYAVPSPPAFSFINGYALDLTRELREANYDHPCSVRCLVDVNEHLYDELRY